MTKFDDRLRVDLEHVAERATPSPITAWDAIQARIADQADQPQMEITMLQPDIRDDRRVNAKLLAAVAAAVVLLAGLSFMLFAGGDSNSLDVTDTDVTTTVPAPTTTLVVSTTEVPAEATGDAAAVQVAFDFLGARSIYDGEAAGALIAPDAQIFDRQLVGEEGETDFLSVDEIDFVANADFERVTGVEFDDVQCEATEPGRVTCTFGWENDVSRSTGDGQYTDIVMRFEVGDGLITRIDHSFVALPVRSPGADVVHVYWTWSDWLIANHADDVAEMMNANIVPLRTAETIDRWEQYTAEFVTEALVPMAVTNAEEDGELVAFSEPGSSGERVRSILPFSMDLAVVPGPGQEADGSTWMQVLSADARDLNGWVDTASLIAVEGEIEQPRPLFEMASSVRNALLQPMPANRLADRTDEVRVSIDGPLDASDPVYQAQDLSTSAVVAAVIEEFGATNALLATDRISINTPIRTTENQDTIAALFPEATVVELHYSGDAGDEDATWESVLMILVPNLNVGTTATDIVEDSTQFKIAALALFTATS